jgi:ABC-type antimicrobial peptide transport system permease subunit
VIRTTTSCANRSATSGCSPLVLGVFALVALVVGAIGVFGVVSFAVSRRTREIGIRMALGATRGTVRGAVFGRGMILVGGGIVLGVVAALGAHAIPAEFPV